MVRASRRVVNKVTIERGKDAVITVPDGMDLAVAEKWIHNMRIQEQTEVATNYAIEAFPTEGAVAFARALDKKFGFFQQIKSPGFWPGEYNPPRTVSVQTGVGEHVSVPWGRVELPDMPGYLSTGFTMSKGRIVFTITGETIRKFEHIHDEVAELTRKTLRESSIYRGKAIDFCIKSPLEDDFNPIEDCPTFIDVSGVVPDELVFSRDVWDQIDVSLFTPIQHRRALHHAGVPFKRGVLLVGDYGVGKSLCAAVTAKLCEANGVTFMRVTPASRLADCVEFARYYPPCVVFCEDIDRAVAGDRDVDVDHILNTIDGIDSKSSDIMVVLTSNHLENIHEAMLRPGRLDSVVHITPPDAEAVEKLIRNYAKAMVSKTADLTEACKLLAGLNPAIIREAVERAKLASIKRLGAASRLEGADLEISARGLLAQNALVKSSRKTVEKPSEVFARQLGDQLARSTVKALQLTDRRAATALPSLSNPEA